MNQKNARAAGVKLRTGTREVRTANTTPADPPSRETTSLSSPQNLRASELPLPKGRRLAADSFDGTLSEAWSDEHYHLSNRAIAERDLQVDERIVRKWRSGEKAIPLGALYVLPVAVVRALLKDIEKARGISR